MLVLENPGDEPLDALVRKPIKTGHFLRIALEKALEEIRRPDDRLAGENRVVRERVAQKAQLLSEQKRVASEFDRQVAERRTGACERNEDLQLQATLLQHLPVSAWTLKPDGTPDFVNQVWLEFSGQTLDFVRSHPEAWMTAVHPDDWEKAPGPSGPACARGRDFRSKPDPGALWTGPIGGISSKPWFCAMQKGKSSDSSVRLPTFMTKSSLRKRYVRVRATCGE